MKNLRPHCRSQVFHIYSVLGELQRDEAFELEAILPSDSSTSSLFTLQQDFLSCLTSSIFTFQQSLSLFDFISF